MVNKYLLLGAVVAGLGVAYMLKQGAGAVVDTVAGAAQAVNPLNNDNIINKGATSVYQAATGSTGTIGGDLYDATHGGVLDDVSWWQLMNPAALAGQVAATAVKKDTGWTLGGQIYDWTH